MTSQGDETGVCTCAVCSYHVSLDLYGIYAGTVPNCVGTAPNLHRICAGSAPNLCCICTGLFRFRAADSDMAVMNNEYRYDT